MRQSEFARRNRRVGVLFGVESMESRRLLSVSLDGGVLNYAGSAAADSVYITYIVAGDKIVVADRYSIRVYGPDTAPPPYAPVRRRPTRH